MGNKVFNWLQCYQYCPDAATREPMPTPGKIDVLPEIIKDLENRSAVGTKKYGTILQTHNGRNSLMDAYQEALDLCMYLKQALLEQDKPLDITE